MYEIFDILNRYSGLLCFLTLLLLCTQVAGYGRKLTKEIKFLFRRGEILDVNDNLRHVPRDLDADFFHKQDDKTENT